MQIGIIGAGNMGGWTGKTVGKSGASSLSSPIHGMKKNCVNLQHQPEQQQKPERFKKQRRKR